MKPWIAVIGLLLIGSQPVYAAPRYAASDRAHHIAGWYRCDKTHTVCIAMQQHWQQITETITAPAGDICASGVQDATIIVQKHLPIVMPDATFTMAATGQQIYQVAIPTAGTTLLVGASCGPITGGQYTIANYFTTANYDTPQLAMISLTFPRAIHYDQQVTLIGQSTPGALCTPDVLYDTGRHPTSLVATTQIMRGGPGISWDWHEMTHGGSGLVRVTCAYQGGMASSAQRFTVTH